MQWILMVEEKLDAEVLTNQKLAKCQKEFIKN
jgi:hypothetical protein